MTDPEILVTAITGAIVAAGGTVAAAIKFGLGRMVRHQDAAAARQQKAQEDSTAAIVANAGAFAAFAAKLGELAAAIDHFGLLLTGPPMPPRQRRTQNGIPTVDTAPRRKPTAADDPDSGDYGG
jgi:hypothetical protein